MPINPHHIYTTHDAIAEAARRMTSIWDNQALEGALCATCPRCNGSGQELVFMHYDTCQVCHGAKTVLVDVAKQETASMRKEREKWSSK